MLYGQPPSDLAEQKAAMQKLAFLVGKWSGEASVIRGPGGPLKVLQTEEVQFKLDGLVLLIEGTGRNPATGARMFSALATVAYDTATKTYRFRAYNEGRYLDTELKVPDQGFEWGYKTDAVSVRFVMHLNDKGEWVETGEATIGNSPPRKTLEMTVRRQP
jgi:hypothetical protein